MQKLKLKKVGKDNSQAYLNDKLVGTEKESILEVHDGGYEIIKDLNPNEINQFEYIIFDHAFIPFREIEIHPISIKLLSIYYSRKEGKTEPIIYMEFTFDFPNWSSSLSPNDFSNFLVKKFTGDGNIKIDKEDVQSEERIPFDFYIYKGINPLISIDENLNSVFDFFIKVLDDFLEINKEQIIFSFDTFFSFPEEYKTACEQYLLYFTTFLKDLGIEAKTDIENQENGVLFKVFPKDKEEALIQIKEALAIYLALPVQQNIDEIATQFPDAAVQQLISNVYYLKSQLVLANATILKLQKQNEALELFQYQNKPIIHLGKFDKNQKNEEKTFGGIATVKEYEGTGFNIDLPKLFRMMKRIWGK